MIVQSPPLLAGALTLGLMLTPSVSQAQGAATETPSTTRLETGSGMTSEAWVLNPDEQVNYWSILLKPLLASKASKTLMLQLIPLIQQGARAKVVTHLIDAIDAGTAASLIFDRSQDPSLLKFLLLMAERKELEVPTQSPVDDNAPSTTIEALESLLRQANDRANEAHRELEIAQDRLVEAVAAEERAADLRSALASVQMRADSLSVELSQALAQLNLLERERQFIPSTLSFPLTFGQGSLASARDDGNASDNRTSVDQPQGDRQAAIADSIQIRPEPNFPRSMPRERKASPDAKRVRPLPRRALAFSADVQSARSKVGLRTVPSSRGNDRPSPTRSVLLPSVLRPDGIPW